MSKAAHDEPVAEISLRLRDARQLFDLRDPAPFRERDLDEKAVEYLLAALSDTPSKSSVRYILHIDEPLPPALTVDAIMEAVRGHFSYERDKVTRELRDHMRRAQLAMLVGVVALGVLLTLARLSSTVLHGAVQEIVAEGLTITGWVGMWRPLELIAYDWWPFLARRRLLQRLLAAKWVVQLGQMKTGQYPVAKI